jgi:hydrogenase nickel incorporation protein HypA/HybF
MHEWALAESVLEAVKRESGTERLAELTAVTVHLGELQNIEEEIFTEGLRTLAGEYGMGPEVFAIEREPALFLCSRCGRRWGLRESGNVTEDELEAIHFLPETAHLFISCPQCGSGDYRIEEGRGVSISGIRLAQSGGHAQEGADD